MIKGSNKNVALAFSRRQGNPSNDAGRRQGVCPSQGQMKPQKCLIVHCQQSTLPGWSRKSAIHVCTSSVLPGQPHIRPEYKFSIAFKHCSRLDSLSWEIIGPARHGGACFHLHAWGGGEGWDSVEGGSIGNLITRPLS